MNTFMKRILVIAVPTMVLAIGGPAQALQIREMGNHTRGEVVAACKKQGGTFTNESEGSFNCTKNGNTVECNKNNECVSITKD